MAKQLMFDDVARAELKDGLQQLADAVKVTLGPTGKNVILHKSWGSPKVTKDGVSVSKEIELLQKDEGVTQAAPCVFGYCFQGSIIDLDVFFLSNYFKPCRYLLLSQGSQIKAESPGEDSFGDLLGLSSCKNKDHMRRRLLESF